MAIRTLEKMSRKDRIDAARSLADFHLQRVAARHSSEWRLAFSGWAVSLVAATIIEQRPPELPLAIAVVVGGLVFAFLLFYLLAQNSY